jgi:hypothetical protein
MFEVPALIGVAAFRPIFAALASSDRAKAGSVTDFELRGTANPMD